MKEHLCALSFVEQETNTQRDPRAFNACRHGLTGQVLIMTPADELAHTNHCQGILASVAVEGDLEKSVNLMSLYENRAQRRAASPTTSAWPTPKSTSRPPVSPSAGLPKAA